MTGRDKIAAAIAKAGTYLCIGVDPPLDHFDSAEAMLETERRFIEFGSEYCAGFKFNLAFFEARGRTGWEILAALISAVPDEKVIVLDAKRADISTSAQAYAHALFKELRADAITVNPYMGRDSIEPFVRETEWFAFVLAATSNPGAHDFQMLECGGIPLYERVVRTLETTAWRDRLGYVVGATQPSVLASVRRIVGHNTPLLVPGVGAQGGDLVAVLESNAGGPMLVNVSRALHEPFVAGNYETTRATAHQYRLRLRVS
ncbi:MAG: orotidine-5'-phosphate decarboxylase [Chlorobi bacterium]|nr:orotidine-5'-phosphate decarboxylase [Chlorobiota bacterium]